VIAVDTNLLVYAHRTDAAFHQPARAALEGLALGRSAWAIPWPCVHEFISVVTHPRIFKTPTPVEQALFQMQELVDLPQVVMLSEGDGYLNRLSAMASSARTQGGAIHDARIAALCLYHGVTELWSADRDFTRFPQLAVRNPLKA
jgi:toxin-antitoxin system PIN domain toxin